MRDVTGVPARDFRRAMGCFATGVTVVTCRVGPITHGITINSLTSVSLNPPLVLICVDLKARAHDLIREAGVFGVNLLTEGQVDLSIFFARRLALDPNDELSQVPYRLGVSGAPLIEGCLAYLECRLTATHRAGDHSIFVAEVIEATVASDDAPLLFYRGRYPRLAPEPTDR